MCSRNSSARGLANAIQRGQNRKGKDNHMKTKLILTALSLALLCVLIPSGQRAIARAIV